MGFRVEGGLDSRGVSHGLGFRVCGLLPLVVKAAWHLLYHVHGEIQPFVTPDSSTPRKLQNTHCDCNYDDDDDDYAVLVVSPSSLFMSFHQCTLLHLL